MPELTSEQWGFIAWLGGMVALTAFALGGAAGRWLIVGRLRDVAEEWKRSQGYSTYTPAATAEFFLAKTEGRPMRNRLNPRARLWELDEEAD